MSEENPLISFILLAYNQENFIAEAIQGAFSQTYSPLEIILSDDCSTDRTYKIMQDMASSYQGPHKVVLNNNERNLGLIGHINYLMKLVHGELIIGAAGDDISLPQRSEIIYQTYKQFQGQALSLYSKTILIGEKGETLGFGENSVFNQSLEFLACHQVSVIGSAHAWHKKLFDIFGPLDDTSVSEDVIIPFRAALIGQVIAIDDALVLRRYHTKNIWLHPKGSNYKTLVNWQKERFEKRIDNLIGIYQTKLHDLEQLYTWNAKYLNLAQELRPLVEKSIFEAKTEKYFYHASIATRIYLILCSIKNKVPIFRLSRWIIQYNFPSLYYRLYRLPVKFNSLF